MLLGFKYNFGWVVVASVRDSRLRETMWQAARDWSGFPLGVLVGLCVDVDDVDERLTPGCFPALSGSSPCYHCNLCTFV